MSAKRVRNRKLIDVRVGDVVQGSDRRWWQVVKKNVQDDGFVQLDVRAHDHSSGNPGYISGPADQKRPVQL